MFNIPSVFLYQKSLPLSVINYINKMNTSVCIYPLLETENPFQIQMAVTVNKYIFKSIRKLELSCWRQRHFPS